MRWCWQLLRCAGYVLLCCSSSGYPLRFRGCRASSGCGFLYGAGRLRYASMYMVLRVSSGYGLRLPVCSGMLASPPVILPGSLASPPGFQSRNRNSVPHLMRHGCRLRASVHPLRLPSFSNHSTMFNGFVPADFLPGLQAPGFHTETLTTVETPRVFPVLLLKHAKIPQKFTNYQQIFVDISMLSAIVLKKIQDFSKSLYPCDFNAFSDLMIFA